MLVVIACYHIRANQDLAFLWPTESIMLSANKAIITNERFVSQ